MNAIFTNAITNALHAIFLFLYFSGALFHFLKKDGKFNLLLVTFFFTLFILKLLGVYVHYADTDKILPPAWIAISLLVILLNYSLTHAMAMPNGVRLLIVFISIAASFLFLMESGSFFYIAMPILLIYLIAAFYSSSWLRFGFIMVVLSNLLWIGMRGIANYIAGHEISPSYRYDNDFYHILLIISTFIIYKSIAHGYLKPG